MGHASSSEFEQDPDIRSVRRNRVTLGGNRFVSKGITWLQSPCAAFHRGWLKFLMTTLTSAELIKSGTVQPSRSYSDMQASAKPL